MEKKMTKKTIPLDYIRGLIIAQNGSCAITGIPLDPKEVNADHIIPLSREKLKPSVEEDNIWLVHKRINSMKGTMTYSEFIEACQAVIDHHETTIALLDRIRHGQIRPVSKKEFDLWVEKHCDDIGKIGSEQSHPADPE